MHRILRFPRWLVRLVLVLYFVLGLAWLGLRYVVLPQVEQWRGLLAQQLSQSLGAQVTLGAVSADWRGVSPRLTLRDVVIQTRGERMELPYLHATPSWHSVIARRLEFARLAVTGLDVTVRRDPQGRVWILNQPIGPASTPERAPAPQVASPAALPGTVLWFLAQPWVDVRDVTVRWVDEARGAPPLLLERVRLQMRNQGAEHQFALSLTPPAELARALDVRAHIRMEQTGGFDLAAVQGRVYARADAINPAAWRPWLDVPAAWQGGALALQASAAVNAGALDDVALNLEVEQGQWQWQGAHVGLDAAQLYVEGGAAVLLPGAEPGSARPDVRVKLKAAGVSAHLPDVFDDTLHVGDLALAGQVERDAHDALRVMLNEARLVNADMDVTWRGAWRAAADAEAGLIDWRGQFQRLDAPAIVRYLPKVVGADARAWLRVGILGGQIQGADFSLQGDLAHFPFGDAPDKGDFSLSGRLRDGIIDYAATAETTLPWPRLDDIQGSLAMRRVALKLAARHATMTTGAGLPPLVLSNLTANIPNIERDAQLTVQGESRAPAQSYLGLINNSPLGARLDHVFAEATAEGQWELPLTLVVPLAHSLDLTVDGQVRFKDSTLQLMPEMPPFSALNGTVAFTHEAMSVPDLRGQFLGGAVQVGGGVGGDQSGFRFAGRATADALGDLVGSVGMARVQGQADYTAVLQRAPDRSFALQLQSDLRGLALDLPAPLNKTARAALPLQAHWGTATGAKNTTLREQALDVSLGADVRLRLLRRAGDAGASYFRAGAVVVGQALPAAIAPGLHVDVRTARIDSAEWQAAIAQFSQPRATPSAPAAPARALLPDLTDVRVHADALQLFGLPLQNASVSALQTDGQDWRIALVSEQTKGMVLWRAARAGNAAHVEAQFDRLALGAESNTPAPDTLVADHPSASRWLDPANTSFTPPSLDLHIGAFSAYGHALGELTVKGAAQGDAWLLESVRLAGAGVQVQGKGQWQLRGPERGLQLDAQAQVTNLGTYLAKMGLDSVMNQGQGGIQAQIFWNDFPWRTDLAQMQGTLDIQLEKGRFNRVHSRAARMLELLSIQSLQRLAHLSWNLDGLTREGFPFDLVRGAVILQDGKLQTHDFRVAGPVGTIAVSGVADVETQRQDLRALVIPNLDMSGAALAAGIVNPVVGVGALLTQWLLKGSVQDAMAVQYRVQGTWDEPEIHVVSDAPAAPAAQTPG